MCNYILFFILLFILMSHFFMNKDFFTNPDGFSDNFLSIYKNISNQFMI